MWGFGKSKDKGKAPVESSSKTKKRRTATSRNTDVEMPDSPRAEPERGPKPEWKRGPLSNYPREWQAELFRDKMNTLKNKAEGFICERAVPESDFGPFGVHEKFRALGWEEALNCHDGSDTKLYMDEIEEWVATLRHIQGNRPPVTSKLVGTVQGIEVTMDFSTLRQIARFDSKDAKSYRYPSLNDLYFQPEQHHTWSTMVNSLFKAGRNTQKLLRQDLKIEPKLLLMIVQQNVMPRRGDKKEIRHPEIPVLYTLMNGSPRISYKYLVMSNIWISRESHERCIIPHCRLITALLRHYGAIKDDAVPVPKRNKPFTLSSLGPIWTYTSSDRYHRLKSEGQRWKALKADARQLEEGEEDEVDSEEEAESDDDVYVEEPSRSMDPYEGYGRAGVSRSAGADTAGSSSSGPRVIGPNWAYDGTLDEIVRSARPTDYYNWPEMTRTLFDHNTRMGAQHERSLKEQHDRYEQWNRTHAYAIQQEINDRYEDDRRRRMHEAYIHNEEVVADPMIIDYSSLPPYDGATHYPVPPVHHSRWIDPRETMQQPPQPPPEGDAFGFGEFNDVMTSIFGPPGPKYY